MSTYDKRTVHYAYARGYACSGKYVYEFRATEDVYTVTCRACKKTRPYKNRREKTDNEVICKQTEYGLITYRRGDVH